MCPTSCSRLPRRPNRRRPRVVQAAKDVDEAPPRSIVERADGAIAAKRLHDAMQLVERGLELRPDDAPLARLVKRIREVASGPSGP